MALRLLALGDVQPARANARRLAARGPRWLWEPLAERLAAAELRFANFEAAVGRPTPDDGPLTFRVPADTARAVVDAGGLNLLSVANNHALDAGPEGLLATVAALDAPDRLVAGGGPDRVAAVAPRIRLVGGLAIGLMAYTDWPPTDYLERPGEACLATVDEALLPDEIARWRGGLDALVVSFHWGLESQPRPTARQRRLAATAVAAGADLILGHGPHVAQPIETIAGAPVAYSLGNAVFDRADPIHSQGLAATFEISRAGVTLREAIRLRLVDGRPVI